MVPMAREMGRPAHSKQFPATRYHGAEERHAEQRNKENWLERGELGLACMPTYVRL